MVGRCANPSCAAALRKLQDGRFFQLEADLVLTSSANLSFDGPARSTEYFWLCGCCSKTMTLRLGPDGGVVTYDLRQQAPAFDEVAFISRHEGRLLRRVVFFRNRGPQGL